MKTTRLLFFAVLPLVLSLIAFAVSASTITETPATFSAETSDETKLQKKAYFMACAWSKYKCSSAPRPHVVYEDMSTEPGLLGYYFRGDDTIYINEKYKGTDMGFIVLVHESVHYLQYHGGAWEVLSKATLCGLEKEAFDVAYKVSVAVGYEYNYAMRGWDAMRELTYGCGDYSRGAK